jgi:uncharacterized metal-binding protein YceD (DUF177 family)
MQSETSSRFAYHGDEPTEGGVRSTRTGSNTAKGSPSTNGVPGPEERQLDISELVRNVGMHYTHRFAIPPQKVEDLDPVAPLEGEITLTNTGAVLLLRGQARTTLRMECSRCLNPTEQPVSTDLEEEFDLVMENNAFRQDEVQAKDDESGAPVISGNILDLAELLRQTLLVAAPWQPLCREDCPGLSDAVIIASEESDEATEPARDNPLRHLGELWNARENAEKKPNREA